MKVDSEARTKGYWATDKLASFKNKDGSPAYVQKVCLIGKIF
ncbi:RB69ORF188c hypothetical protein [Escherichia phage RB69]|uniref:Uncharacterized protein RB69ORF188c n=1 Tax=Escherichia phage RB69 TaxID=12353 RepID=Q7Y4W1_BPR69|nr:RB69ORF188c hypothetical protein [Escherichia phage RB69]AAP76087.1 RB69ORF188c hypothetical protein [Escherichia phage RB69]